MQGHFLDFVVLGVGVAAPVAAFLHVRANRRKMREPVFSRSQYHDLIAGWNPPKDLLGSPPRPVKIGALGVLAWIFFGILVTVCLLNGLVAALFGVGQLFHDGHDWAAILTAAGTIVVVIYVIKKYIFVMSEDCRLLKRGSATAAVVMRTWITSGRGRYPQAAFQFYSRTGTLVTGILNGRFEVGQIIEVVYDPATPTRFLRYPSHVYSINYPEPALAGIQPGAQI